MEPFFANLAKMAKFAESLGAADFSGEVIKNLDEKRSFLCYKPEIGFLVLHPFLRGEQRYLLVEAAWCKTGKGMPEYLPIIEEYARTINCVAIEFHTVRVGFKRLARRHGFTEVESVGAVSVWRKPL